MYFLKSTKINTKTQKDAYIHKHKIHTHANKHTHILYIYIYIYIHIYIEHNCGSDGDDIFITNTHIQEIIIIIIKK